VPGARVVTTPELFKAIQSGGNFLLVDAWDDTQHETIPGAVRIPYAGRSGTFNDDTQRRLFQELSARTNANPGYPIVFFCAGARCWESYNATLRAQHMGFSNVFWYRGGMAAWRAARRAQSGSTQPDQGASEPETPLGVTAAPARSYTATLCGRPVDYRLDRGGSGSDFTGVWTGSWNNSSQMCGGLIVEQAQPGGSAKVIYVYGPSKPGSKFGWKEQHRTGRLSSNGRLSFEDEDGNAFAFNLADSSPVEATFSNGSTRISGVFQKSR
jgi:PQQ-dependent catabolism-associated CXXCW motif protein